MEERDRERKEQAETQKKKQATKGKKRKNIYPDDPPPKYIISSDSEESIRCSEDDMNDLNLIEQLSRNTTSLQNAKNVLENIHNAIEEQLLCCVL